MYGALTRIAVKAGTRSELLDYLRWDADVAKNRESGTLRFDVWEVEREPDVVYVYEAYRDVLAFEDHQKNEPYKKWGEMERAHDGAGYRRHSLLDQHGVQRGPVTRPVHQMWMVGGAGGRA